MPQLHFSNLRCDSARCARFLRWRHIAIKASITLIAIFVGLRSGAVSPEELQNAQPAYVWLQLLPDMETGPAGRLVRAIVTEGEQCPKITQNSQQLDMHPRTSRVHSAFPVLLCEAEIDAAGDAWIGPRHLPLRPNPADNVLVIGDTGCRIVHYGANQPCRDGTAWPFATVAASAAAAIGDDGRSAIIDVGDFNYRDKPCADADPGCGGSPFGDNWATWEAEFFKPASPLLLRAPWVILRGNHENCARAGIGWTFFFALPFQYDKISAGKVCQDDLEPYRLTLRDGVAESPLVLVVLDTADAEDTHGLADGPNGKKGRCSSYRDKLKSLISGSAQLWLALHQPLWFLGEEEENDEAGSTALPRADCGKSGLNAIRAVFTKGGGSGGHVRMVLSGDTHLFELFDPVDRNLPVQLVAGNGGTRLVRLNQSSPAEPVTALSSFRSYGVVGRVLAISQHGFVTLRRAGLGWNVELHNINGGMMADCRIPDSRSQTAPCKMTGG
jgi:hypothetical protein